jgi:ferredoxin
MKRIKAVLTFPPNLVEEPITYQLITDYGLRINILRASIDPGKQGRMVVELEGEENRMAEGLNYLEHIGVEVGSLAEEIRHIEERCTACTACVPHCPSEALVVERRNWQVNFLPEKCVLCLSCVDVCIYRAMSVGDR